MLRLVWSERALFDLDQVIAYIGVRNYDAAERLQTQIEACAERLPSHPFMHRLGRDPGTREAVAHPNYILVYEVHSDEVEIMAVIHSRREYPPSD